MMRDVFGQEVQVGDAIAYSKTAGRSSVLAFYRVEEVGDGMVTCREFLKGWARKWKKDEMVDGNFNNRRVGLSSSDRMMVIPSNMLSQLRV